MNTPDLTVGCSFSETYRLRRILLVEDNPTNQRLMRRLLENMDCEVQVAGNGREALEKVGHHPFDLIFMDCHMPVMDGFTATEEIRRTRPPAATLPIVAVTASVSREDHDRCRTVGMNEILTKPVNPEDILSVLKRWCVPSPAEPGGSTGAPPRRTP